VQKYAAQVAFADNFDICSFQVDVETTCNGTVCSTGRQVGNGVQGNLVGMLANNFYCCIGGCFAKVGALIYGNVEAVALGVPCFVVKQPPDYRTHQHEPCIDVASQKCQFGAFTVVAGYYVERCFRFYFHPFVY